MLTPAQGWGYKGDIGGDVVTGNRNKVFAIEINTSLSSTPERV